MVVILILAILVMLKLFGTMLDESIAVNTNVRHMNRKLEMYLVELSMQRVDTEWLEWLQINGKPNLVYYLVGPHSTNDLYYYKYVPLRSSIKVGDVWEWTVHFGDYDYYRHDPYAYFSVKLNDANYIVKEFKIRQIHLDRQFKYRFGIPFKGPDGFV